MNNMPIFQILSIVGSLVIILSLIELVRSRRIKESYSILWFFITFVFLLFSLWRDLLEKVASLMGVGYAPAALFLILIIGLYLLSIHFSVVISRLSERNKDLSQEIGLLNLKIKELKKWTDGTKS
jgi:hypothetical protein